MPLVSGTLIWGARGIIILFLGTILLIVDTEVCEATEVNNKIKQMIEDAGCPFVSRKQLLVRNVCIMPDYQQTELPEFAAEGGITKVDIYLHEAKVLEIDELKDKITIKISQLMEWGDFRVKANFSEIKKPPKHIKLSPRNTKSIWHPGLDMFTKNLEDWKSLHDPYLFQEVLVSKSAVLTMAPELEQRKNNASSIHAWKDWVATIYCQFDFSTFPLDTQHCSFLQMGTSDMILPRLFPSLNIENWYYRAGGFDIRIKPIGAFEGNHTTEVIGFNVTLERIIHPYLYQYYFPCIAIVVVSHISLIIPISAIPGRITLAVTQFLTLTNIFIHFMVSINASIKIISWISNLVRIQI